MPTRDKAISRLALDRKLITPVQLSQALAARRTGGGDLVETLIAQGAISREQADELARLVDAEGAPSDAEAQPPREAAPDASAAPSVKPKAEPDASAAPLVTPAPQTGMPVVVPASPGASGRGSAPPSGLVGGYEIVAKLGSGGMGPVYRARKPDTGELVALRLFPSSAVGDEVIARFRRETGIARGIDHAVVAKCIEFGAATCEFEGEECHYCAMELVEGENLNAALARGGALSEKNALTIAKKTAGALGRAYGSGIAHTHIRPANIMVTPEGQVMLLDLGLPTGAIAKGSRRKLEEVLAGCPYYVSPEIARGEGEPDVRSDIYSLGATLYHMLTGAPPFDGGTVTDVLRKHADGTVPWPADVRPKVSEGASMIVAKMMAKDPDERYRTPMELVLDLDIVLQGSVPVIAATAPSASTIAPAGGEGAGGAPPPRRKRGEGARARGAGTGPAPRKAGRAGEEPEEAGRSSKAYVVAGVLGVAAVAAVVVAFLVSMKDDSAETEPPPRRAPADVALVEEPTGGEESAPPPPGPSREERAKELYESAVAYSAKTPEEFARAITNFQGVRAAGKGTQYEALAEGELGKVRERWRDAALAELERAKERAAELARDGDFEDAIAVVRDIRDGYASRIRREIRAESDRLAAEARQAIDAAVAEAERLLAEGNTKDARAALKRIEGIRYEAGRSAVGKRVMSLLMKISAAEEAAGLAAARKAEDEAKALLSQFDGLVDEGNYQAARDLVGRAAAREELEAHSAPLLAAGRVATELAKRRASIRGAPQKLVGKKVTVKTSKGLRRGELEDVTDEGLHLAAKVMINRQVRRINRFVVAWEDLAVEQVDEFAKAWTPAGADGAVAKAIAAISLGRAESANEALAAAGDHPLAGRVRAKLASVTVAEAAGSATASPAATGSPAVVEEAKWPPTREAMQGLFRGKLLNYSPSMLKVELLYDFENTEQLLDWQRSLHRQPYSLRNGFELRDGAMWTHEYGSCMLLEGVYTSVLASVNFRSTGERRPSAGLLVCASHDGSWYNFFGLRGRGEAWLSKHAGPTHPGPGETAPSPLAGAGEGSFAVKYAKGRVTGQVGQKRLELSDASLPSGRVGLWGEERGVAFDDLRVEGTLDARWLKALVAVRRMGAPHDAFEFAGHWYRGFDAQMSWHEAKRTCEEVGGHLVAIGSAEENNFAAWLAQQSVRNGEAWIGFSDERREGVWEWVTGEPGTFGAWREGQPDGAERENYAAYYGHGQWRDYEATRTLGFVCEWDPARTAESAAARARAAPSAVPRTGLLGTYCLGTGFEKPVLRRVDATLDFNWTTGAPAPGFPADGFSIRWEGSIEAPETGDYVFAAEADDGVALTMGRRKIINSMIPGATRRESTPVSLKAGTRYPVRIEYNDLTMSAHMRLFWTVPGRRPALVPTEALLPPKDYERSPGPPIFHVLLAERLRKTATSAPRKPLATGLLGSYFQGVNHEKKIARRVEGPIDFSWRGAPADGVPADQFSIRWEGFVAPPKTGTYTLSTSTDDGVRLAIAGVVILEEWWGGSRPRLVAPPVDLEAGKKYPIRLEVFDVAGQCSAKLLWKGPGSVHEVVPDSCLVPPASAPPRRTPAGRTPREGEGEGEGGEAAPAAGSTVAGAWSVLDGPNWGNPATVAAVPAGKLVGDGGVAVECLAGGVKDKVFVAMVAPPSLAGMRTLSFVARNAGKAPVEIAVAVETGLGYFETMPANLKPGKGTTFSVDLLSRNFKTKATNWQFTSPLKGAADTRRLMILIYNTNRAASLRFSGLRSE